MLKGKTAIITGASSGIGASIAEEMAKEGANLILSDINDKEGQKLTEQLKQKFNIKAFYVHADVSSEKDCNLLTEKALEHFNKLDIAVNNAGISGEQGPLIDCTVENWKNIMAVNLDSIFYCMKSQIPAMIKSGGGSVINMSSILGSVGFPNAAPYVATKHAMNGLTKTAAWEYAQQGVRVNAIGPAFIKTPLLEALDDDMLKMLETKHAFNRLGKPVEVANLAVFLASDKASFLTGSYFPADGGYLGI
ncbi:MAG: SDR family oxidoreductase [Chitinophagaceae bacterium]|nr:MAG: SDR family oxidoreductase [Chitinophagaceae bacterium]